MRTIKFDIKRPIPMTTKYSEDTGVYQIPTDKAPQEKEIARLVKRFKEGNLPRLQKLRRYYDGYSVLLDTDNNKQSGHLSDSVTVSSYPSYIVDTGVDHFANDPVKYSTLDSKDGKEDSKKATALLEKIQALSIMNDETSEHAEMATNAGIYGIAYEYSYQDNVIVGDKTTEVMHKYVALNPENTFAVRAETVDKRITFYIQFSDPEPATDILDNDENAKALNTLNVAEGVVKVYTKNEELTYSLSANDTVTYKESSKHVLPNRFPVRELKNDVRNRGDFENVLRNIEAYNQLQTTNLNDMEYLADALFVITGGTGSDADDLKTIMTDLGLQLPEGMDAKFITKDGAGEQSEVMKKRVVEEIHKLSRVPDFTDENFAGNSSGVAMDYKLIGFNAKIKRKLRYFTEMIRDRIAYSAAMLGIKEATLYDENRIVIDYSLNTPHNDIEAAEMINALSPWLSKPTLLSLLSFVEEPKKEIEAKTLEEDEEYANAYDEYAQAYQQERQAILEEESARAGTDDEDVSAGSGDKGKPEPRRPKKGNRAKT